MSKRIKKTVIDLINKVLIIKINEKKNSMKFRKLLLTNAFLKLF